MIRLIGFVLVLVALTAAALHYMGGAGGIAVAAMIPGLRSMSFPDRRVLVHAPADRYHKSVCSHSTNADAGGPRTSYLRPGNVLLKGADNFYYDDVSGGVVSAAATVTSSEAVDGDWASETVTLTIDGQAIVTVSLGAEDDTAAEVVTALNANATFRAHAIAAVADTTKVSVTLLKPGAEKHLLVTSSLATAFGASGQQASGTDGQWVVCLEYVDQLDPLGSAVHAMAHVVDRGDFDEGNLIWGGSSTLHSDFKRVMIARGSRFL